MVHIINSLFNTNMHCPFITRLIKYQHSTYLSADSDSVSYLQLGKAVQSYRNFLLKNLVHPNQIFVSLSLDPFINAVFLWTCLQLKISFFPINPKFPPDKIISIFQAIQPNFVCYPEDLSSDDLNKNLHSCLFFSAQIFVEILKNSKDISLKQLEKEPPIQKFDFSTFLLTSGTSGVPKVVAHNFSAHWVSAQGVNQCVNFDAGDRWLLSLPMYHVSGLSLVFRALSAGACLTTNVADATHISWVPTQLLQFLQNPFPIKPKAILLGGAPLSTSLLLQAAQAKLPLFASYGLTETASSAYIEKISLSDSGGLQRTRISIPHREVKVQSKTKRIRIQGEILGSGYRRLDNPKFLPLVEEDGWFTTPDLGEIQNHVLNVLGRTDLVFSSGGENVSPITIETHLLSIPGVLQAVVVEKQDDLFGFVPVAFVLLKKGFLIQDVIDRAKATLVHYETPKQWFAWHKSWTNQIKPCRNTAKKLVQENSAISL